MAATSSQIDSDDPRLTAVERRDWRADGSFVYAVTTTGVYCRPSCPSRRPKPENIRLFSSFEEAERDGYRPCLRCEPRAKLAAPARAVQRACEWIDEHHADPDSVVSLKTVAKVAKMSPFHLHRLFKRFIGLTPQEYAAARRAESLKEGLRQEGSVTEAIYDAGYSSSSRVYEHSAGRLGMTPGEYRRHASGVTIAYDIVATNLGSLILVAATQRGLCRVAFGHSTTELVAELCREFPKARLRRSPTFVRRWTAEVLRLAEGEEPNLELPLDIKGAAFQWRVWTASRLPRRSTESHRLDG